MKANKTQQKKNNINITCISQTFRELKQTVPVYKQLKTIHVILSDITYNRVCTG